MTLRILRIGIWSWVVRETVMTKWLVTQRTDWQRQEIEYFAPSLWRMLQFWRRLYGKVVGSCRIKCTLPLLQLSIQNPNIGALYTYFLTFIHKFNILKNFRYMNCRFFVHELCFGVAYVRTFGCPLEVEPVQFRYLITSAVCDEIKLNLPWC